VRRISLVAGSMLLFCVTTAVPALADSRIPEPSRSPRVLGNVIHAGGTAFTGADVFPWLVVAAVLLVGGLVLLALSRRRGTVER